MAMQRWDPFVGLGTLERDIDRMWSRVVAPSAKDRRVEVGVFAPTTDVLTRGDDMVVRVELPGVMEKDIDITITDDILTITGRREEQTEKTDQGGYLVRESFRGSFERSMSLPAGIDAEDIVAKYEDGVLEVVVPKAAAMHERRTRHIELQSGERKAMDEGH
jgi:HSP20 family protein